MESENVYYATGKRKCAIAKTWLMPGSGKITINKRQMDDYFSMETAKTIVMQPLELTSNTKSYDIKVSVLGGGITGQAGAIRHGITKVLLRLDPELRGPLKKAGFVKRDPRQKERKKYGQPGARKRFQFSKR